ncbi:2-amino-4-hydroxy-6-hydroxymethyldihydropteridine diphosphokinase [Sulfitobacter sp. F26204]|uniref:2-amino-4-hydroxy-6- hydroxymethyldihydropteridine diphosphokinase n=1 Tax=Sulfitobacter sp. F26204 TaxID=2996014 RepID=UPI00225DEFC6|nr:2-amino-4-hydroxy-6-hydroxymethyldihydropteridine diphosphokinase [Sulfitobacter sp. F26204]MCX7558646.1 2-amino-4-hydroxy-6-hydroxymethyldihydropteridine diphosphokinase [Sulfitobacter sp. F26204]
MLQPKVHGEMCGSSLKSGSCLLLALGANLTSNVGAPEITLRAALELLKIHGATIRATSPFYSTPAYPAGNGPDYINAAVRIAAPWSPAQTLETCHQIEAELGRKRAQRWGQRTLDLDLIAYDDQVLPDPQTHARWRDLPVERQKTDTPDQLILPHPRLQERAFVLVPLADVAPEWVHPALGLSVAQMRDRLDPTDLKAVCPLSEKTLN